MKILPHFLNTLLIFLILCFQNRIQIKEDIPKYLRSEVKFLTTPCVVLESEKLGLASVSLPLTLVFESTLLTCLRISTFQAIKLHQR